MFGFMAGRKTTCYVKITLNCSIVRIFLTKSLDCWGGSWYNGYISETVQKSVLFGTVIFLLLACVP